MHGRAMGIDVGCQVVTWSTGVVLVLNASPYPLSSHGHQPPDDGEISILNRADNVTYTSAPDRMVRGQGGLALDRLFWGAY